MLTTGVYAIWCVVNGKAYVGSAAQSLTKRKSQHWAMLRHDRHYNPHLQRSWDKYGEHAFDFVVLERCVPCDCVSREQHWIDYLNAFNRSHGFNMCPVAGGVLGRKHREETRAKMSESAKRRFAIHGHPWLGKKHKEETKAKMAANNAGKGLGRKLSPEVCKKISESQRGRRHTQEAKDKMRESMLRAYAEGRKTRPTGIKNPVT